jgi:hypothetical protein
VSDAKASPAHPLVRERIAANFVNYLDRLDQIVPKRFAWLRSYAIDHTLAFETQSKRVTAIDAPVPVTFESRPGHNQPSKQRRSIKYAICGTLLVL